MTNATINTNEVTSECFDMSRIAGKSIQTVQGMGLDFGSSYALVNKATGIVEGVVDGNDLDTAGWELADVTADGRIVTGDHCSEVAVATE